MARAASSPAVPGKDASLGRGERRGHELAGLPRQIDPVVLEKGGLFAAGHLSFYIKRDGRQGQAAGQEAERALEDREAPRPDLVEPAGGLDPEARRDPEIAAHIL